MFQGTIPDPLRRIVHEHARLWPHDQPVYVGCSGNLTIERTLAELARPVHSNDVNPYSCALGWYLSGQPVPFTLKPESQDALGWLKPYLDNGAGTLATLMLGTRFLDFVGRDTPYHRRMVQAYRDQWDRMHTATVAKLQQLTVRVSSFYAGDVRAYLTDAPPEAPVAMFPPFWCLAPHERILSADFEWVPCGDLVEGQRIVAFDEHPQPGSRMRRWRFATITRSEPAVKDCVRVHLANGDTVECTSDHPWLAAPPRGGAATWVEARDLIRPSKYPARDTHPIAMDVYKPLTPWGRATTFEDGWLSGVFDGEGSLMMPHGNGHGSPKLALFQVPGRVADRAVAHLRAHGFEVDVRTKTPSSISRKPVQQMYVSGGFPEIARALGTFQPMRLIDRLTDDLDISLHSVRVNTRGGDANGRRVRVTAVEPLGPRPIQSISTDAKTYVGEGYLMHNTGGYETMFKGIEQHFDWPEPDYPELDDAGKREIIETVMNRPNWLLGLHYRDPDLEPYRVGYVQLSPRAVPIEVYARPGAARWAGPRQKTEPIKMPKIGTREELGDTLTLHPMSAAQFAGLRSMFLDRRIAPGTPHLAVGVASAGRLIGAFAYLPPKFDPTCAYLMSDFPIGWSRYKRLSKLIVMAATSVEAQALLQRSLSKRLTSWATTAFTNNPTSGKYGRGIPHIKLRSRKPCEVSDHTWQLDYGGPLGSWTLAEALQMWRTKHAQHTKAVTP